MAASRIRGGLVGAIVAVMTWPANAYQEATVTDGGVIEGKVVYNGSVPMRTILPTKDQEICGEIREEPEIMVDADKGVQDGVVFLKTVEQGKPWPESTEAPVLDNKDCRFVPHVQAVPAGQLAVLNSDPLLHNTHGFYGRRTAFNIALPNQGQQIDVDLTRSGTVRLECDAHGWMLGWVYVVDNPYFAVTSADGSFEIADVPPGNYVLVADHAFTGPIEMEVTVDAGGTVSQTIELAQP